jgi:hypothetical protein
MKDQDWKEHLQFGQKYERLLLKYLSKKDDVIYHPQDEICTGYDFSINGIKYEVKADRIGHKTGNICIEIEQSNKLSGLSTTTSDRWLYYLVESKLLINIPVKTLRKIIKQDNFNIRYGGYLSKSRFILIPISLIPKRYQSYPQYDESND